MARRTGVPSGRPVTWMRVRSKSSAALGSVYCRKPASGLGNWLTSNGGSSAVRQTCRSAASAPGSRGPTNRPPTTATASSPATVTARVPRPPPSWRVGRPRPLRTADQPMATRANAPPWSTTDAGVNVPSAMLRPSRARGTTSAATERRQRRATV